MIVHVRWTTNSTRELFNCTEYLLVNECLTHRQAILQARIKGRLPRQASLPSIKNNRLPMVGPPKLLIWDECLEAALLRHIYGLFYRGNCMCTILKKNFSEQEFRFINKLLRPSMNDICSKIFKISRKMLVASLFMLWNFSALPFWQAWVLTSAN